MKKTIVSKCILLALVLLLGSAKIAAQYKGKGTFTKITSIVDLTDAYYVIVNSGDAYAMNNYSLGKFFDKKTVKPLLDEIIDPSISMVWYIESDNAGRTIYNEALATYVSYSGSANEAYKASSVSSNNQRWIFTYVRDVYKVQNMAITDRFLQYNDNSPRFACYRGTQQHLLLYKLDESSIPPIPPLSAPVATAPTNIGTTTFTAHWDAVEGATNYELSVYTKEYPDDFIYPAPDQDAEPTISPITGSPFTVTAANSKAISGLALGTCYYYTITAVNDDVSSESSNEVEVKTKDVSTHVISPSQFEITGYDGKLYFSALGGEQVQVYNAIGKPLTSFTTAEGLNIIPLNTHGVLLVKVGSRMVKLILQ